MRMRWGRVGVVLCGLGLHAGAQVVGRPEAGDGHPRSIAITATDRVVTQADLATVHIGYLLYGPDHDAAYAAGSQASQAIVQALKAAGVKPEQIESQEQNLTPTEGEMLRPLTNAQKTARAFTVRQSWTVKVNAKDGAEVLDLAVHAGANDAGQIDWSLRDANAPQAEAATRAMQRARTQAAAMASGLNVRLGTLLYASNEVNAARVPLVVNELLDKRKVPMAAAAALPMAINPQQIETAATVYAVFAIE